MTEYMPPPAISTVFPCLSLRIRLVQKGIEAKWCKIKCDNKINQVFFILTTRELSVNRNGLQAPTLAGPPCYTKDLDP